MSAARTFAKGTRRLGMNRAIAMVGTGSLLGALVLLGAMPAAPAAAAGDTADYSQWKTLTRERVEANGAVSTVDTRTVTVSVDQTSDLRGRESVLVSWAGARPSAARTFNPYGYDGMNQEYPVVILQCRGLDDPNLPAAEQVQPETCWTSNFLQRFGNISTGDAVWQHDLYAADEDTVAPAAATWPSACGERYADGSSISQHLLPFRAANGTIFQSCTDKTMPPEGGLLVNGGTLPAEVAGFTRADGKGEASFEVRTAVENESLGCSEDVPCSIVVIPIMGISCADADAACNKLGRYPAGSTNKMNGEVDYAVSPYFWWSESNWRNRFSVPLDFAPAADVCDVQDSRAPVAMYGSELLNQASLQWAPAYCLRADRFKFQHNRYAEPISLRLLETGEAVASFVSEPATTSAVPLGYAPVAVSGFAVAYVSDLPDNAGELTTMRLTPRLIAKLLTQSYPASSVGTGRAGLEHNPWSLNVDPEFLELNPEVNGISVESLGTVLSLSTFSDVLTAVTQYIAADPEAMAFLAGEPDRWGMVINPSYLNVEVPRSDWPLLDGFIPKSDASCAKATEGPYLQRVASPVSSLRKIAEAVLDGWPNSNTLCDGLGTKAAPYEIKRVAPQPFGARNMLGLVSLGDAERYGLRTAELRTAGTGPKATFVAATEDSMAAAVKVATQTAAGAPFTFDRSDLPATAYPGTMVVHATARLSGLDSADSATVAEFIQIATTEGQEQGRSNGELPEGYLPILESGPTAKLFASAQLVATAIEAQTGTILPTPAPTPTPAKTSAAATTTSSSGAVVVPTTTGLPAPGSTVPAAVQSALGLDAPLEGEVPAAVATGSTAVQSSAVAQRAVAGTLLVSLSGMLGAPALWAWSTRRRLL